MSINSMFKAELKQLKKEASELCQYALNDKIQAFVEIVTDEGHELRNTVLIYLYGITGLNCNTIENLNFFIGNFLLDDSSFVAYYNEHGHIRFRRSDDIEPACQDSELLIEVAKSQIEYATARYDYYKNGGEPPKSNKVNDRAKILMIKYHFEVR